MVTTLLKSKNINLIKVLRQDNFSTRLPYANKKIRDICYFMVNALYNSSEGMISKLQKLKGKIIIEIYQKISNFYDEMKYRRQSGTFQFEKDIFSKGAQGISKIYHEVNFLMNLLQTKPQVKNMNIEYYDLYYTVTKNKNDKEIVNDEYENNENDYIKLDDTITTKGKIGI